MKRLFIIAALITLAATLHGCGKRGEPATPSGPPAQFCTIYHPCYTTSTTTTAITTTPVPPQ